MFFAAPSPRRMVVSSSMDGHPFTMAGMATKEVPLLSALTRIGNGLIWLFAHFTNAFWDAAFPKRRAFLQSISRCPYAATGTATKAAWLTRWMIERFFAYLANSVCGCHASPSMIAPERTKIRWLGAISGRLFELNAAMMTSKQRHNKAPLTRGADIEEWGKPVSVSSGSKWFMRPLLSLSNYTTDGITALQIAPYAIDGQSDRRSHSTAYRADGLEVRTNTNASDCLRSFLVLELETA